MARHKGITIELTPDQLKKLAPVFRTANRIKGAAIVAQVFEDGARVVVLDPEIAVRINGTISKCRGLKPKAPRLVQSVKELGKGRK